MDAPSLTGIASSHTLLAMTKHSPAFFTSPLRGEVAPKARVRGTNYNLDPLTRLASLAGLSPQGRGVRTRFATLIS